MDTDAAGGPAKLRARLKRALTRVASGGAAILFVSSIETFELAPCTGGREMRLAQADPESRPQRLW